MAYCKRAFATSVGYFTKRGNHQWTRASSGLVSTFELGIVLTTEEEHSTMRDLVSPKWCKITLRLWGASLGMAFLYYGAILAINIIFSLTEKEEQQDSDTFNFDNTAIIASSLAEIVGFTLVILTVDTKGRIPPFPNHVLRRSWAERVSFSCVCLLRWKCHEHLLLTCSFSTRFFMMGAIYLLDVGFHFGNFGNRNTVDGPDTQPAANAIFKFLERVGGA
jgi:hypothetical protein